MLVYGVISPHPTILIPEIGGKETIQLRQTAESLDVAARELAKTNPEKLIIISPHAEQGYEVPLYFLGRYISPDTKLERILVTNPLISYYYELGLEYADTIAETDQRIAIIASGDLSHVLKDNGPYGYNPDGAVFDNIVIDAIRENDISSVLNIDEGLLVNAAECGLRPILFLLGVLYKTKYTPQVLSYESPYGVGYMVATFTPE